MEKNKQNILIGNSSRQAAVVDKKKRTEKKKKKGPGYKSGQKQ